MGERTTWADRYVPAVDTRTRCVVGWTFHLHMAEDDQAAFDEINVAAGFDGRAPRPLALWTQKDVAEMVAWCRQHHPTAQGLRRNLEARLYVKAQPGFELSSLREA